MLKIYEPKRLHLPKSHGIIAPSKESGVLMVKYALPKDLCGDWIWTRQLLGKVDSHLFARREFSLDASVPYAELWVSACSAYHLFVNGTHIGYGPSPATREMRYADRYEISCHLQAGQNSIAIHAHHLALTSYTAYIHSPGIWCQLNIDGAAFLWTDNRWRILSGACYESSQPRRHSCQEFVEKLNFESFPFGYQEPDFNDRGWERPDIAEPIKSLRPPIAPMPCDPCALYESDPLEPVVTGRFEESGECTHVSFASVLGGEGGVYAAQTFFKSEIEADIPVAVASDDPFALFANDAIAVSRGFEMAHSGHCAASNTHSLHLQSASQGESPLASGRLRIKKGWNRLLLVQESGANGMGFFTSFPTLKKGSLKFMRDASPEAIAGWKLAGPLRMPLAAATGSLRIERLSPSSYTAVKETVNDISSWLASCKFEFDKGKGKPPVERIALGMKAGECAIYDIGSIQYGFVSVELTGGGGDIVDITCSVRLAHDGRVPSFGLSGRNSDTVTLRAGSSNWLKFDPRGVRRIMLTVRKTSSKVFPKVKFVNFTRERDDEAEFSCSDNVFNKIWETSKEDLRQTTNNILMDSPCGKRSQSLPEAFVESVASFYTFGESALSAKAIREFALAQTENGNIPEFSSNGIYSHVPDYALLWPLWLDAHYQATGDAAFRDEMLPHLALLLDFFGTLSKEDGGLLIDLDRRYRMHCVIDRAPIDRRGMCTALNALYCRALLSASSLYLSAGRHKLSDDCQGAAAKIAAAVRSLAFDPGKQLFADCYIDGQRSESHSIQTNVMALLSGIAPFESYDQIMDAFLAPNAQQLSKSSTPLFKYFLLETMFAFGRTDKALDYIRSYWGAMLEAGEGLWWSLFDPDTGRDRREPESIQCYGGAVSPNIFLAKELAGIRPAVPGFSRVYFNPACKAVSGAKLKLPTPYGKLSIEWKLLPDGSLDIQADANYPLDIAPTMPPELLEKCTFHLGKSVNLLDPESAI